MKTLTILRGVSGSGKSSFAELIGGVICCADDFFMVGDEYKFDPTKLKQAHAECFDKFKAAVERGEPKIVISNTNTQTWEFDSYKHFAETNGYRVFVVVVENRHGGNNVHGVPDEVLEKQKARFRIAL